MEHESGAVSEHATAILGGGLTPFVRRCVGYRHSGRAPGSHRGLPSAELTLVLSFGPPTRLAAMPDRCQPPSEFVALLGGLHTSAAVIAHDGELEGVQLDLTPRGARALFGVPAGELGGAVVSLDEVIGRRADELIERALAADGWPTRFAEVADVLGRGIGAAGAGAADAAPGPLEQAWRIIVASGGSARVGAVADAVGWSRRQLDARFGREYGVTPKQLARIVRFDRSHRLLRGDPTMRLAALAATCGYYDQAHMARDWNQLAGCAPSRWLADEDLPFIQDEDLMHAASLAA